MSKVIVFGKVSRMESEETERGVFGHPMC